MPIGAQAPTQKHSGKIELSYDRFQDRTVLTLKPKGLRRVGFLDDFTFSVSISSPGHDLSGVTHAFLLFSDTNARWTYLGCSNVTLLVNGERLEPPTRHTGTIRRSGGVVETVLATLTLNEFMTLANADTVEGRLCRTEFTLSRDHLLALKDVAGQLK